MASCCSRPRPHTAGPKRRSAPGCPGPACGRAHQRAPHASAGTAPALRKWARGAGPAGTVYGSHSSFFPPSLVPRQTKKRRCRTKKCRPALGKKPFFARRKPPDKMCRSHGPRFSMIQKDGMMRVYIAILLLLLFIDRFTLTVSQVCALAAQFHGCKGTNL